MLFTVLFGLPLAHIKLCIIYMLFTASLGLPLAHIELFSIDIYIYIYICFLQPLLGLSLAHEELFIHVYGYMPFTAYILYFLACLL